MNLANIVMHRIQALGRISEDPSCLTRQFCSDAMQRANKLVASWMREAGMEVRQDTIGNLIGHYPSQHNDAKTLLLGSHLDTVRDAGRFDGPLGVLVAIACVQNFHQQNIRLPFAVDVLGFADEEGVRYQTTYLGSKVVAGEFDPSDLKRLDANGISMAKAIQAFGGNPARLKNSQANKKKLLGYAEVHIEQGPVLEKQNLSVGIVSGIAGQTRVLVRFLGCAGHAGTTPMSLRKDALCAAAEFICFVEKQARKISGLVATVGQIEAKPGASNVIPGFANLSLDIRHQNDAVRNTAVKIFRKTAQDIARKRTIKPVWQIVQATDAVLCSRQLMKVLGEAVKRNQKRTVQLPSGAGHDAAIMARITPAVMLFVRCKGGISHHPGEWVKVADIQMAIRVMSDFLQRLAKKK